MTEINRLPAPDFLEEKSNQQISSHDLDLKIDI